MSVDTQTVVGERDTISGALVNHDEICVVDAAENSLRLLSVQSSTGWVERQVVVSYVVSTVGRTEVHAALQTVVHENLMFSQKDRKLFFLEIYTTTPYYFSY